MEIAEGRLVAANQRFGFNLDRDAAQPGNPLANQVPDDRPDAILGDALEMLRRQVPVMHHAQDEQRVENDRNHQTDFDQPALPWVTEPAPGVEGKHRERDK